jgi:hypothetical protein
VATSYIGIRETIFWLLVMGTLDIGIREIVLWSLVKGTLQPQS